MIKLPTTTWIELYSEISQYVESRAFPNRTTHNEDGSRRAYTEDDFVKIVNDVEEILSQFFEKENDWWQMKHDTKKHWLIFYFTKQ